MLLMRIIKNRIGEKPHYESLISNILDDDLYVIENIEQAVDRLEKILNAIEDKGYLDNIWRNSFLETFNTKKLRIVNFRRSIYEIKVIFTFVENGDKVDLISDLI